MTKMMNVNKLYFVRSFMQPSSGGRVPLVRLILALLICSASQVALADGATSPARRFMASLNSDSTVPAEIVSVLREAWSNCTNCDESEFLTQALVSINTPFRRALDAYDAGDYPACIKQTDSLQGHPNLFIRTNAAAFRVKALVAIDRLQDAGTAIDKLLEDGGADLESTSYFGPEISFLRGYCLLANLDYDAAEAALKGFVQDYPNAPQRLVVSAQQILAELATRQPGRIGEVVDLMHFSQRRLSDDDASKTVQQRQKQIVDILSSLIEEAQQQEKSQGGGQGGGSGSGRAPGQSPSSPMQQSTLPGGSSKGKGKLGSARRANPGDAWGSLAPAQRDKILQALRDSFPARYRQLVEQYYEELAKKH